ncbi:MAG: hypothetical protein HY654_08750, partial [Acidobacteria bacterium]|nr:hypothetical protein [Acidobacteriota bacterium]
GWITGPSPLWKASDQHIINDRWLVDLQWAHLGNNFILDFHEDSLNDVQPIFEITTGVWGRSFQRSGPFLRPTNSVDLNTNYFLPGVGGGDHAIKAGYRWRIALGHSETHRGGNTIARFRNGVASEGYLYRDAITEYDLKTHAFYIQDNYSVRRLNLNLGIRWDRQRDTALSSSVPAHPFAPQWLPAVTFGGADSGVVTNDFSPRLGSTYDLTGDGKTIAKASFAMYYGQMGPGSLAGILNPVGEALIGFPWTDGNRDMVVQANELDYSRILTFGGNYNPNNPSFIGTLNTVDPNIKNDRTREFIAGFDREIAAGFGVGASYIWRKYDQFSFDDRVNFGSADYTAVTFTPTACPAGARCETITYYQPTRPLEPVRIRTNLPDFDRVYNGFELVLSKRHSHGWSASASFAYNDAVNNYRSPASYEDPTNIDKWDGAQFAPESGGSGIDNIFTNAKWLVKISGIYTVPRFGINLAANSNFRQGYPFPQAVRTPSRANAAGVADVLLDPLGDVRHPNVAVVDFRADRPITLGGSKRVVPSIEIFNLGNVNTVLARRRLQAASNANLISGIVAPRVIRFGMRINW